ncbi:uncharacterized protein RCC_09667 [Ramularia collo-cygni]|uniref:Uncharacterized protein n=1 Tax=Ramularia collo-cygni TaxID=112498 RepID=A0A2D3VI48_9PEZI|nr:uncharacterized protein RCC_09667 [Ramularia collo-cygni]CZT23951.1 uncharacterized protein RCC_09667 [Ramularia collo-cygni]
MPASKMSPPQNATFGRKRSADELDANIELNSSPACDATARGPPSPKKVKLEEDLNGARKDFANGETIRKGLSKSIIKETGDMVELQQLNKTQELELQKRHVQLMALHDENEELLRKAKKAERARKAQEEVEVEAVEEMRRIKEELKKARKENNRIEAECEEKSASDAMKVASLQKKIDSMVKEAHKDQKKIDGLEKEVHKKQEALKASKKAAAIAKELASTKLRNDARSFSGRLEKRDAIIEQLEKELKTRGIEIPKRSVQTGRPK